MPALLYIFAFALLVMWFFAFVVYATGAIIHLLLLISLIFFLMGLVRKNRNNRQRQIRH